MHEVRHAGLRQRRQRARKAIGVRSGFVDRTHPVERLVRALRVGEHTLAELEPVELARQRARHPVRVHLQLVQARHAPKV